MELKTSMETEMGSKVGKGRHGAVVVSDRDYRRILALLKERRPNARLRAAIAALPDTL
jgi:hypothetical protein